MVMFADGRTARLRHTAVCARWTAAALTLAASCAVTEADSPSGPKFMDFPQIAEKIYLDGRLDETVWLHVTPRTNFFEVDPANVGPAAVRTLARFAYDERNIYVGIRAFDPEPAAIRSSIVQRDQVTGDQDYVEVVLDPLNTRRNAFFFRVNAAGIVTDGQYDEATRLRDYLPDFDFDAATSIDAEGWTAELRIPLTSLRYQSGSENVWAHVVFRNLPRENVLTLANVPIPRGADCILCYADVLTGISGAAIDSLLLVTPYVTYAGRKGDQGADSQLDAGFDLTWKPREDTVIDATLFPDFSQVEADAPQLTANAPFALAVTEKRPFFLEGTDLLTTPIPAVYTRAFTDPDAGLRITGRSRRYQYTTLLLRDAGGGTVIDPGTISSRSTLQDFESDAFASSNRLLLGKTSLGLLATGRFNDDGSQNVVLGADTTWTPTASDQVTIQFLKSDTRNPSRPDLLETWIGQRLLGSAGSLEWTHSSNDWYAGASYQAYSRGFRAWNGFVTQVGVSSFGATGILYSYPRSAFLTRIGHSLSISSVETGDGMKISQAVSPGISIRATRDTTVAARWTPGAEVMTLAGPRSYHTFSVDVTTTPFSWMPQATLSLTGGESVDNVTGEIGDGFSANISIPLRFFRLKLVPIAGYQTLKSRSPEIGRRTLFTERRTQINATWHFSEKLYIRATHEVDSFEAQPGFAGLEIGGRSKRRMSTLLLSYQTSWRTRCFIGVRSGMDMVEALDTRQSDQDEIFAKVSYAFSTGVSR